MKLKVLLILMLAAVTFTSYAQDGGIRGKVVSRNGRVVLSNVQVKIESLGLTAMTDKDGNFMHKPTDVNYYIQDALDAIEYAIGPTDSKYGAMRAENGHPEPFPLKYVEIGNEDFGPVYYEKYHQIYKALKERYPHLIYIANSTLNDRQQEDLSLIHI